jgi:hypothetical protein
VLHRQKGVSCGPAPNGTVIYELRKRRYRLWEVAVLFHLRDAFRSGDVWLAHSRRYGDLKQVLVPMIAAQENAKLAVPSNPRWLADRKARLTIALKRLARAARNGTIQHGSIEDGTLRIDRLTADVLMVPRHSYLDLYRRMPSARLPTCCLKLMQPLVSQMRLPI